MPSSTAPERPGRRSIPRLAQRAEPRTHTPYRSVFPRGSAPSAPQPPTCHHTPAPAFTCGAADEPPGKRLPPTRPLRGSPFLGWRGAVRGRVWKGNTERPLLKALPTGSGPPVPGEGGPARRDGGEAEAARSSAPPEVIRSQDGGAARGGRAEGARGAGERPRPAPPPTALPAEASRRSEGRLRRRHFAPLRWGGMLRHC